MAGTIYGGRREGNSGDFLRRVSERRRRIATFIPGHWKTERRKSQDIVVSARGWLVVNPVGVATPTVGWNEHPSQRLLSLRNLFLISVLLVMHLELYMLTHMLIKCE